MRVWKLEVGESVGWPVSEEASYLCKKNVIIDIGRHKTCKISTLHYGIFRTLLIEGRHNGYYRNFSQSNILQALDHTDMKCGVSFSEYYENTNLKERTD